MLATLEDSGVLIHAKADYAEQGGRANAPIKLDYLSSDHQAQTDQLIAQMNATDHGTLEFVMDGKVWILSFQQLINQDSFVVVAITRETIDAVANGILEAMRRVEIDSPIVIRLDGTNAEEGRAILAPNLSDKLMMEETMLGAARKAVELAS